MNTGDNRRPVKQDPEYPHACCPIVYGEHGEALKVRYSNAELPLFPRINSAIARTIDSASLKPG